MEKQSPRYLSIKSSKEQFAVINYYRTVVVRSAHSAFRVIFSALKMEAFIALRPRQSSTPPFRF
jgi:hypothetical protein